MMNGTFTYNGAEKGQWCHVCAKNGFKAKLQYFQINFEEAILLCPTKECTYPLDAQPLEKIIVKRKAEDIFNAVKRKKRKIDQKQADGSVGSISCKKPPQDSEMEFGTVSKKSPLSVQLAASRMQTDVNESGVYAVVSPRVGPGELLGGTVSGTSVCTFSSAFKYAESVSDDLDLVLGADNSSDAISFNADLGYDTIFCDKNSESSLPIHTPNTPNLMQASDGSSSSVSSLVLADPASGVTLTTPCFDKPTSENPAIAVRSLNSAASHTVCFSQEMANATSCKNDEIKKEAVNFSFKQEPGNAIKLEALSSVKQEPVDSIGMDIQNSSKLKPFNSLRQDSMSPIEQGKFFFEELVSSNSEEHAATNPAEMRILKQGHSMDHSPSTKEPDSERKTDGMSQNEIKPVIPKEVSLKFLQWQNKESLCWLDVVMSLLTHCKALRSSVNLGNSESCLKQLVRSFDVSQKLFRQALELRRCELLCRMGRTVKLETSIGDVMVKTGGGSSSDVFFGVKSIATIAMDELEECIVEEPFDVRNIFSRENPNTVSIEKMSREANRLDALSKKLLGDARDNVFADIEPNLQCRKGQNDSPLLALMTLLSKDPIAKDFEMQYYWTMNCSKCKATHKDSVKREIVTFMRLPDNFTMSEPCFVRECFSCKAPDQLLRISFDRIPDFFFHHFLEGIKPCDVADLDFEFQGHKYAVTGLVQYKKNPDHFVSWLREPVADCWMECDDLKNCICKFSPLASTIPSSQVHIVMWEKQSDESGYQLPCRKGPREDSSKVLNTAEQGQPVKFGFPVPALTPLPAVTGQPGRFTVPVMTLLPAVPVVKAPLQKQGIMPSSVSPALLADQYDSSKSSRNGRDVGRLERMKQKFEMDKKRFSGQNYSKPLIPRIPVGIPSTEEYPIKKNALHVGKTDLLVGKSIPSVVSETLSPKKTTRSLCPKAKAENRSTKQTTRPGHCNFNLLAAAQSRASLKIGHHSYLENILPLVKKDRTLNSSSQKFAGYIPKSQKSTATCGCDSLQDETTAAARKARVCFSENHLQQGLSSGVTSDILQKITSTAKGGILAKPSIMPKSLPHSKLVQPKTCTDEKDFDVFDFDTLLRDFPEVTNEHSDAFDVDALLGGDSDVGLTFTDGSFEANSVSVGNNLTSSLAVYSSDVTTSSGIVDAFSSMLVNTSSYESVGSTDLMNNPQGNVSLGYSLNSFSHPQKWTSSINGISDCCTVDDLLDFNEFSIASSYGSEICNEFEFIS